MNQKLKNISRNYYGIILDIEKYLPLKTMMENTTYFNELSKQFRITIDELYNIVTSLHIAHNSMYQFEQIPMGHCDDENCKKLGTLVEEKTHKWERTRHGEKCVTYYNTYIVPSPYIGLNAQKIVECILEQRFPNIFKNDLLFKEVPRFKEKVSIYPNTILSEIPYEVASKLTCEDIVDILNGNIDYLTMMKSISKVKHYNNSLDFYIELEPTIINGVTYSNSLSIPYEVLFTKDWSLVENLRVNSILKKDAKPICGQLNNSRNFFNWLQKDCPYYNTEEVKEIKELFLKYL